MEEESEINSIRDWYKGGTNIPEQYTLSEINSIRDWYDDNAKELLEDMQVRN